MNNETVVEYEELMEIQDAGIAKAMALREEEYQWIEHHFTEYSIFCECGLIVRAL